MNIYLILKICIISTPAVSCLAIVCFLLFGNHGWGFWSDLWKLCKIIFQWCLITYIMIFGLSVSKLLMRVVFI